jgi:hypothetical protein
VTPIPDDILKAIEVATEAKIQAISFDGQIAEDNLKYSSWMSALAIAALLMIAANFSDFRSPVIQVVPTVLLLTALLIFLSLCLVSGGLFHRQVIKNLMIKRQIMTAVLKQHSILLSSKHEVEHDSSLCGQVWEFDFLSEADRSKIKDLRKKDKDLDWLLILQMILLVVSVVLIFTILLLGRSAATGSLS